MWFLIMFVLFMMLYRLLISLIGLVCDVDVCCGFLDWIFAFGLGWV